MARQNPPPGFRFSEPFGRFRLTAEDPYIVVDFEEYEEIQSARAARKQKIEAMADQMISENLEAFQELAK